MAKCWVGGLAGFVIVLILVGCGAQGATGQVESLSPGGMKETLQDSDNVYILVTDASEEEKRDEYIKVVEENIEEINVKEINAQNQKILDGDMDLNEIGLEGSELFQSLSYYEDGRLHDRISLKTQKYKTLEDRDKAIQKFINETSS
ncbi:hypothetical protein AAV35_011495 [Salimicrobium jeotgali]|uniref:Lipoprotein n=1 Tax=Salimicrobium jeotgali TaxID=1230341 RepID=K2H6C4_9BACI|nr:hypothetical protein [Salimicrobium jeotgali]AKG05339.1 hypothetical protein AAV35_011495 [Salimicrobium jeotgali]EKE31345.1 hypothetical protein MJ3_08916 [Salimicrobium jeotgali]MBM7696954.1 hypothetical protein [Salimicrobium jeotgali]